MILSAKVDLTANTYPTDPHLSVDFDPREYLLRAESGGNQSVIVSFDGKNDHLVLPTTAVWPYQLVTTRQKQVWFRLAAGGATTVHCTVKDGV